MRPRRGLVRPHCVPPPGRSRPRWGLERRRGAHSQGRGRVRPPRGHVLSGHLLPQRAAWRGLASARSGAACGRIAATCCGATSSRGEATCRNGSASGAHVAASSNGASSSCIGEAWCGRVAASPGEGAPACDSCSPGTGRSRGLPRTGAPRARQCGARRGAPSFGRHSPARGGRAPADVGPSPTTPSRCRRPPGAATVEPSSFSDSAGEAICCGHTRHAILDGDSRRREGGRDG